MLITNWHTKTFLQSNEQGFWSLYKKFNSVLYNSLISHCDKTVVLKIMRRENKLEKLSTAQAKSEPKSVMLNKDSYETAYNNR